MSTIARFKSYMLANLKEFTYRWWTERDVENHNFFYHIDDKFYEAGLREEAEDLLLIVFENVNRTDGCFDRMDLWARTCSTKRALQEVPVDETVERFRMFRRILLDYFHSFAEKENLTVAESLHLAEELNNNCELSMQQFTTHYMAIKEQYFQEQQKRFDVERLAAIGQMAAGVAHEVRNPLTASRGFLQLLQESAPHYFLDIAMEEIDRAIQTIKTMLDVAKPTQVQAQKEPVALTNVLHHVVGLFHEKLYKCTLVIEFQQEEVRIEGCEELLKQAFFNVLKNALEAMKDTEHPVLTLRHYERENCVVVEVQDNGEGIPKEKVHLLGTPFFTLKKSGVGLGLTMVYRTMHEHFAQVSVESEAGQGVLFRFSFPVRSSTA